jgi:hypothetical protein
VRSLAFVIVWILVFGSAGFLSLLVWHGDDVSRQFSEAQLVWGVASVGLAIMLMPTEDAILRWGYTRNVIFGIGAMSLIVFFESVGLWAVVLYGLGCYVLASGYTLWTMQRSRERGILESSHRSVSAEGNSTNE